MSWFYAQGGRPVGPVPEDHFAQLITRGLVTAQTLVWRQGMPTWQPYKAFVALPDYNGPAAGLLTCTQCGRYLGDDDLIRLDSHAICAACKPIFFQRVREGTQKLAPPPEQNRYAVGGLRLAAMLIDVVAIGTVQGILMLILAAAMPLSVGFYGDTSGENMATGIVVLYALPMLVGLLYDTWFVGRFGATPGKLAVGVKVIVSDGRRVTYRRALARFLASRLSVALMGLGHLMAFCDNERRTLHDHICNTRVVRK